MSKLNVTYPKGKLCQHCLDRVKIDLFIINEMTKIKDVDCSYIQRGLIKAAKGFNGL